MKKQLIPLLSSLAIVALMGSALSLLLLAMPEPAPAPDGGAEQKSASPITAFSFTSSQIDTVELSRNGSSFLLTNLGDRFSIKGYEDIPLDYKKEQSLMTLLNKITASRLVGRLDDRNPKDYGLDLPASSVTITTVQEEPVTLSLGSVTEEGQQYLSDGVRVYVVSHKDMEPFLLSMTDYADHTVTTPQPDKAKKGTILLSGPAHPSPITIEVKSQDGSLPENNFRYSLLKPKEEPLPSDTCRPLMDSLFDLKAEQVVALHPTAGDMVDFGLQEPYCTVRTDFDGQGFVLTASATQEDGFVYLMNDSLPIIFKAKAEPLIWLDLQVESLTRAVLLPMEYDRVTAVTVSSPDETYRFTKWDGQVLCNGRQVQEELFRQFYEKSLSVTPSGSAAAPNDLTPLLTVTVAYETPEHPPDVFAFLPRNKKEVYLSYNDTSRYLAKAAVPSVILLNCARLLEEETPLPLPN